MLGPLGRSSTWKRNQRIRVLALWGAIATFLFYMAHSSYRSEPPTRSDIPLNSYKIPTKSQEKELMGTESRHEPPANFAAISEWWKQKTTGRPKTPKTPETPKQLQVVPEGPLIPKKIWQNMFSHLIDPQELKETPTWLAKNPDYAYKLVGLPGADEILAKYYDDDSDIKNTFNRLRNTGIKSDLLRYMLLYNEGGVYTDIDTVALKPIDKWVPEKYRDQVRVLIGLEFDQGDGGGWVDIFHEVQFCQWTIAAAPGHPLLKNMLEHGLKRLHEVVKDTNQTIETFKPKSVDVLTSTGPAAWTDVVFKELQKIEPELTTLRNLSGMTSPRLFNDIMILPIDAFGVGQPHSKSTNDGTIPKAALSKHLFRGSWRNSQSPEFNDDKDGSSDDDVENSKGEKIDKGAKEKTLNGEKSKDEKAREEKAKEDKAKEDKAKEEKAKADKAKEDKAKEEKAKEEKAKAKEEKAKEEKAKEMKAKAEKLEQEEAEEDEAYMRDGN